MDEFEKEIKDKLSLLTYEGKILFSVLTSEKLYPNCVAFENRNNWRGCGILQEAISLTYHYLINRSSVSISDFEDMITRIDLITPDTEDFSDITTSFALDACTSLIGTLRFIIDKDINNLLEVSTYATDTVYAFIQLKEDFNAFDPSSDIQTEHDDFMIREQERQRTLIKTIAGMKLSSLTDGMINQLRTAEPIIDLSLLS